MDGGFFPTFANAQLQLYSIAVQYRVALLKNPGFPRESRLWNFSHSPFTFSMRQSYKRPFGLRYAHQSPLPTYCTHTGHSQCSHTQIKMKSHICALLFAFGCCFRGTFASPTMIWNKSHVQLLFWPWRMTSQNNGNVQTRPLAEPMKKKSVAAVWSKVFFSQGEFDSKFPTISCTECPVSLITSFCLTLN